MQASAVVNLNNTFGAAFVGLLLSTTLLGLTLGQTWIYFWRYGNKDSKALKFFIACLTFMETSHTFMTIYMIYWYLVLNFGNVQNLGQSMWASDVQANICLIYSSTVHFYYARRIYIVSKSIIFPIIIVVAVIFGNILAIVSAAKQAGVASISKRFQSTAWMSDVGMCIAITIDIGIAAVMCWSLYRKKTGFARTDSILMTLMAYSINTGLVTSMLGVAMFISFLSAPATLFWLAIFWVTAKCYVNSLLAMLNSRDYVRDRSTHEYPENAFNLSSIRMDATSEAYGAKSKQTGVSVTVHRTTASDFRQSKPDHNVRSTQVPHPDLAVIYSQRLSES